MAASEVEICNQALYLIGAERISSLTADSKEARICNDMYSVIRDQLLAAHPWNFAIRRAQYSAIDELPDGVFDWDYAFELPANCLRVVGIDDPEEPWAREADYLYTNYSPVSVKFIEKITSVDKFSPMFTKALAYAIAVEIGPHITQSPTLFERLEKKAEHTIRECRSFDAQEGSVTVPDASDFINIRA